MRNTLLAVLLVFTSSCANTQWKDYDDSQYAVSMDPGADSVKSHVEFLQSWEKKGEGLPVGLAAELGYYLASLGLNAEAEKWFSNEVSTYPSSVKFVESLRAVSLTKDSEPSPQP